MCLSWKGLLAVVVIGAFLFFFLGSQKVLAYLPFLLLAICPLSMIFATRGMGKNRSNTDNNRKGSANFYTCPMHPKVLKDKPGTCLECGMNLVPQ